LAAERQLIEGRQDNWKQVSYAPGGGRWLGLWRSGKAATVGRVKVYEQGIDFADIALSVLWQLYTDTPERDRGSASARIDRNKRVLFNLMLPDGKASIDHSGYFGS